MKSISMIFRILFTLTSLLFISTSTFAQGSPNKLKIGTYDSRIIIIAYSRSDTFNVRLSRMQKESEALLQGNDSTKKAEAACRMITYQFLLHQQAFSTGSVSSVLDMVKDKLPRVAKEAGVSAIVSKWELTYQDPSAEVVDLTMSIAKLFNPKGDFEKIAMEIGKLAPATLEEITVEEVVQMWKQFESRYFGK